MGAINWKFAAVIVHRWLPLGVLGLGFVCIALVWLYLITIELLISGGVAHFGINPWANLGYSAALILLGYLCRKYWTLSFHESPRENWTRTIVLILAGVAGMILGLKILTPEWLIPF